MRTGRINALYSKERDSLEGPQEDEAIVRKALKRGKNFFRIVFAWAPKERVRSKVTPKKVGVGLNLRGALRRESLGIKLAWYGSMLKKEDSHLEGLRARRHFDDQATSLCRAD